MAAEVRSTRVEIRGLVDDDALEREFDAADVALLTQRPDLDEFNVPSRLMTLLARGIPVVAATRPASEVRRLLEDAAAGWLVDPASPEELPVALRRIAADPDDVVRKSAAASAYAAEHFSPEVMTSAFAEVVESVAGGSSRTDGLDR